jgi:adenylate cyclase
MFSKSSVPFKSIWKDKESIKISNHKDNPLLIKSGYKECLVSPIIGKRGILGCIVLGDKESREGVIPFEKNDIDILEALSSQAGIAMDNAKLFQEINAAKRFNESIMGSIATTVITVNLLGEIDTINKAGKDLFGDKAKQIIGEHYSFFFSKDKNLCAAIDAAEHELETISELNTSLLTKSRNTKVNYSVAPLKDEKNSHIGLVVAIEDITEQSKIKNTFKRYVSKSVVDQLLDDDQKLNLGGEEREVTVLFSDIRGFTAMSEKMKPKEVVTTLNSYFSEMIDIIFKFDGTLDKIVGDELMVVFGAPIARDDDAERAVKTAIGMIESLKKFNEKRVKKGKVPINAGIGINKGKVISGNIGSKDQMDYTVIGDTVNLGARLCSFAGPLKIIISRSVKNEIGEDYKTRKLEAIKVKGKRKPVEIFKVLT